MNIYNIPIQKKIVHTLLHSGYSYIYSRTLVSLPLTIMLCFNSLLLDLRFNTFEKITKNNISTIRF